MRTTVGQLLVNDALPKELRDYTRVLTKGDTDKLLAEVVKTRPDEYRDISHKLVQLGRNAAFEEGTTLRLSAIRSPVDKAEFLDHITQQEDRITADKTMTPAEKQEARETVYSEVNDALKKMTMDASLAAENPFALQVMSKARGNPDQLAAMLTTPGVYQDAKDNIIPVFIRHSYAEGLQPHEYWCLDGETLVRMADLTVKRICDLHAGDFVLGSDINGKTFPVRVITLHVNGKRACSAFTFRVGRSLRTVRMVATGVHKVLATPGRRGKRHEAARLVPLDSIHDFRPSVLAGATVVGAKYEPRAALLGLLLGDGHVPLSGSITLTIADPLLVSDAAYVAATCGLQLTKHADIQYLLRELKRQSIHNEDGTVRGGKPGQFKLWLTRLGVLGVNGPDKFIPAEVMTWDKQSVASMLGGLLATDGCVTLNRCGVPVVGFCSTSRSLVDRVVTLLYCLFGVSTGVVSIRKHAPHPIHENGKIRMIQNKHDLYTVRLSTITDVIKLAEQITIPGIKGKLLRDALRGLKRVRRTVDSFYFVARNDQGVRDTYDIEVDHPDHLFVLANGITVSNSATYGARKGVISSKFATRQAGYLGKLFGMAVMDAVVTQDDCESPYGIPVKADDNDNLGSVLSRPVAGFTAGTVIDKHVIAALQGKKIDQVVVRSPITCTLPKGVCKQCVGQREGGEFPAIGYHIGLNAASALAEQIAQASLNVKHTGKKAKGQTTYSGFNVIKNLSTVPETFPDRATVAEHDGKITKIVEAPQGGYHVYIDDEEHYVPPTMELHVKEGDTVEAGDQLSDGIVNPADVVRLKGLGEGRRYFADRLSQAFRETNFGVNRRNAEVLARSIVNHVQVDDDDAAGEHLPGDVVTYGSWVYGYRPRKDAKRLAPKAAIGQYLEEPAMHYTVGTRVTKNMVNSLQQHGTHDILAHTSPVGVSPVMMSVVKTPEYTDDWMARLSSSYLKTRLLEDVHAGATSNVHGVHPIPGIAKGTEFGQSKGKGFTY